MVFLGGPRQVGKTTLALDLLGGDENHPGYLNWDFLPHLFLATAAAMPERIPSENQSIYLMNLLNRLDLEGLKLLDG